MDITIYQDDVAKAIQYYLKEVKGIEVELDKIGYEVDYSGYQNWKVRI